MLVRPTRYTEGPSAPIRFYGDDGISISSFAGISRHSVTKFLVDATEKKDWNGCKSVISN